MGSAGACISMSLALHAALLWGVTTRRPAVQRPLAEGLSPGPALVMIENAGDFARAGELARETPTARETPAANGEASAPSHARLTPPADSRRSTPRATQAPAPRPRASSAERAAPSAPPPAPAGADAAPAAGGAPSPPGSGDALSSLASVRASETSGADDAGLARAPGGLARAPGGPAPGGPAPGGPAPGGPARPGAGPAGTPGGAVGPGAAAGDRRATLLEYGRRVRSRIAAERDYPYAARRANLHGTVCLRIELAASGRLLGAEPTCGEGLGPLPRAALAAVSKAAPFPPLPPVLGPRLTLDVPVVFELSSD